MNLFIEEILSFQQAKFSIKFSKNIQTYSNNMGNNEGKAYNSLIFNFFGLFSV